MASAEGPSLAGTIGAVGICRPAGCRSPGATRIRPPAQPRVVTKLLPAECRRLIAAGGIGRTAFGTTSGPVVFPVNFAVVAGGIAIRTGEGTAIDGHAGELVAFEVDHVDEALSQGWSVLVRGPAHRVTHPAELQIVRHDASIWPWPGGGRDVYVRVIPDTITGRRIESR
jgi:Pyridoxamine 5'-phosphate oxidase